MAHHSAHIVKVQYNCKTCHTTSTHRHIATKVISLVKAEPGSISIARGVSVVEHLTLGVILNLGKRKLAHTACT